MTATIDSTDIGLITEVEYLRVSAEDGETRARLQALERSAHALAAEPGFVAANLHVSDDATIVVWRQWADDASWRAHRTDTSRPGEGEHLRPLGRRDIATYEGVYVKTARGEPLSIAPGRRVATLIDLQVTDPAKQDAMLDFNVANSEAFSAQPGFRATAVLCGRDGTRIATYSQWDRVEDWIAAVKTVAGQMVPALKAVETVQEVNAVLQEVSRAMGSVPEYHAYRVTSVIGREHPA